jgi:hypothetical protein
MCYLWLRPNGDLTGCYPSAATVLVRFAAPQGQWPPPGGRIHGLPHPESRSIHVGRVSWVQSTRLSRTTSRVGSATDCLPII